MTVKGPFPLIVVVAATLAVCSAQDSQVTVTPLWDRVVSVSKTTATLQVVVNPPLERGTPVHDNAFQALNQLGADYVRYVPWLPYPKLGVAELDPPQNGKTSWDFKLIDPMTVDFLDATTGHSVILNFSTIPQWMFKTDKPVAYPADPNQVTWDYEQGTEFRDPSMKEVADYYARLLAWYTQGGFTDEYGERHESGYHYKIAYWEVLNEVEFEHKMSPETYTRLYDAVVEAMQKVQPEMKFVGMALALPAESPQFFDYFLNPKNHKAGIPLEWISYHFYAIPTADQSPEVQQYTFFTQAEWFLKAVKYIEEIRKRLSPDTKTTIDEIGAISADDVAQAEPGHVAQPIPNSYWNLVSAMYAYIFGELTKAGIDVAGESQLVGFPTQFPSVTIVDWNTGKPNARYWTLKLLKESFGPGDKIVEVAPVSPFAPAHPYLYSLAVVTKQGRKRLLLVNKRDRTFEVSIAGATGGEVAYVDQTTAMNSPASARLDGDKLKMSGFEVAVVTLP